jgi:Lon protease-like protein
MLNDIGDGVFGFTYTSSQYQKLGLVGTLARVKQRKILEDGRTFVAIEGIERFFIKEIVSEKPYIKAKVTHSHYR